MTPSGSESSAKQQVRGLERLWLRSAASSCAVCSASWDLRVSLFRSMAWRVSPIRPT